MILNDVIILTGGQGPWASPPSRPALSRDGVVLKGSNRKMKYQPIVEFTTKKIRKKFSDAVVGALRASHPDAFE